MTALAALLTRDIRIALRAGGGALIGVLFFLIVVVLTPFAIGSEPALLVRVAPVTLWIGALLANLLSLDSLFATDREDGSLDLILMARSPLELTVAAKAAAQWLTTGLPLVVASPFLGMLLNLEPAESLAVTLTLAVGTPALTFTGVIGAALTVSLRRGGLLLAVLALPLTERGDHGCGDFWRIVHDSVRANRDEFCRGSACRDRSTSARDGVKRELFACILARGCLVAASANPQ
jgi:heme exporter protein B